jgi:hypothetical protein
MEKGRKVRWRVARHSVHTYSLDGRGSVTSGPIQAGPCGHAPSKYLSKFRFVPVTSSEQAVSTVVPRSPRIPTLFHYTAA